MQHLKIVVEEHADGFVAYPVGLRGAVIGQGDTYEAAVDDVVSAIRFHIETFGPDAIDAEIIDARLAEVTV
jgi:predicted RNase H-like HicB family nuclease